MIITTMKEEHEGIKFMGVLGGFFSLFFLLHLVSYGIFVPRPGIEPVPPAEGMQSLNHWTAREVPS